MSTKQLNDETTQAEEAPAASGQAESENVSAANENTDKVDTVEINPEYSYEKREVAAEWRVPVRGRLHKIEFEHGTTSGKRVIWVDEKVRLQFNPLLFKQMRFWKIYEHYFQEVLRRDWMFKLVGDDVFHLENVRCVLRVSFYMLFLKS